LRGNCSKGPETASTFFEFPFAGGQLTFVPVGRGLDLPGNPHQPGLLFISLSIKSSTAFMIGKIEVVRIVFCDMALFVAEMGVPSYKIDCIIEIIPVGPGVSGAVPVFFPCVVFCLCIPIGRRGARAGKYPQTCGPGGLGITHIP